MTTRTYFAFRIAWKNLIDGSARALAAIACVLSGREGTLSF
jgi:hypothetical protein